MIFVIGSDREDPPPPPQLLPPQLDQVFTGVLSIQLTVAVADPVLPAVSWNVNVNEPLSVKV